MDLDQDRPSNLQAHQVQQPISEVKWNSNVDLDNALFSNQILYCSRFKENFVVVIGRILV